MKKNFFAKIVSVFLSLILILSLTATSFAEEAAPVVDTGEAPAIVESTAAVQDTGQVIEQETEPVQPEPVQPEPQPEPAPEPAPEIVVQDGGQMMEIVEPGAEVVAEEAATVVEEQAPQLTAQATTVTTFQQLEDAIAGTDPVIEVGGNITMTGGVTIPAGRDVTLRGAAGGQYSLIRDSNYKGALIIVYGSLTINNLALDGNKMAVTDSSGSLVYVEGGVFTLEAGGVLENNTLRHTPPVDDTAGGVSVLGGEFNMTGGEIKGNSSVYGGVFVASAAFNMSGGLISGNSASGSGGGVHIGANATFNMSGGEVSGNETVAPPEGGLPYSGRDISVKWGGSVLNLSGSPVIGSAGAAEPNGVYVASGAINITGPLSGAASVVFEGKDAPIQPGDVVASGSGYTLTPADCGAFVYLNGTYDIALNGTENRLELADPDDPANFDLQQAIDAAADPSYTTIINVPAGYEIPATIVIIGPSGEPRNIMLKGGPILRGPSVPGNMFVVMPNSTLALRNVTIDGGQTGLTNTAGSIVYVNGELNVGGGAALVNNAVSGGFFSGGVHVAGSASFTMTGGTISGNSADSASQCPGGGVCVEAGGEFTLTGGLISDNEAYAGGGVYANINAIFNMTGGTVSGNTARTGGGIYFNGSNTTSSSINGGSISGNTAAQDGGGIYLQGGQVGLSNATVSGNSAANGGGAYVNHEDTTQSGRLNIAGAAITRNTATSKGGGVLVQDDAQLTVMSNAEVPGVISGNSVNTGGKGTDVCLYQIQDAGLLGVSGYVKIGSGNVGVYNFSSSSTSQDQNNIFVLGALASGSSIIIEGIHQTPAPGVIIAKGYGTYTITQADKNAFTYVNLAGEDYRIYINDTQDALVLDNFDLQREIYTAVDGGTVYVPDGYKIDSCVYVMNQDGSPKAVTLTQQTAGSGQDTIVRGATNTSDLLLVTQGSTLTLKDIIIDGGGDSVPGISGVLVYVEGDELVMEEGSVLKNNIISLYNGGCGVYVGPGGAFTMNGGEIKGNTTNVSDACGGGVFMSTGTTFTMNGGEISGNTATGNGNDVYIADNTSTLNLSGGAKIGGLYNNGNTAENITVTGALTGGDGSMVIEGLTDTGAGAFVAKGSNYTLTQSDRGAFAYLPQDDKVIALDSANNKLVLKFDLQKAIYNAQDGGTVYVPDGYKIDSGVNVMNQGGSPKAVTLTQQTAGSTASTIVRGETFADNLLNVLQGSTLTLKDIILDGGGSGRTDVSGSLVHADASQDMGVTKGGALVMEGGAVLQNNIISDANGGGVYVDYFGMFTMNGGEIKGNAAHASDACGGGVSLNSGTTFTMTGGEISGNTAGSGGGVHVTHGSGFIMEGGEVSGNTAAQQGGDVCLFTDSDTLAISDGAKIGKLYNGNAAGSNIKITDALSGTVGIEGIKNATNGTVVASGDGHTLTLSDRNAFAYLPGGGYYISLDTANNQLLLSVPTPPPPPVTYYNFTFDYMYDNIRQTVQVAKGDKVAPPSPEPTREGYEFAGWYTSKSYDTLYDFTKPVNADTTVYAGWTENPPPFVPVESIVITPAKKSVYAGNSYGFTCEVFPEEATNKDVEWVISEKSGDKATVAADPENQYKATVYAHLHSRVNVTVKALDGSGVMEKALVEIKVTSKLANVPQSPVNLEIDASIKPGVIVEYSDGTYGPKAEISSSSPDVAKVNSDGSIVAVAKGDSIITFSSGDLVRKVRVTVI